MLHHYIHRKLFSRTTDHRKDGPIQEEPVEPSSALANGYTQSKWVVEQLLSIAANETPLQAVAIRVGQITGGTTTGAWNRTEWFPILVKTGTYLGCLPTVDKVCFPFYRCTHSEETV